MALDELLDEHEQGERVRAWLRNNGAALLMGVVLGLGAIFGWKWWQQAQLEDRIAESAEYQKAVVTIESGELDAAAAEAAALDAAPYDTLAAMRLAQAQVNAGQAEEAIATLRGTSADHSALEKVVQLRLARLLLDTGKPEDALSLLADANQPVGLELRGDAEAALDRRDAAQASYTRALDALEPEAPQRRLLEIKRSAVGGTPP